MREYEFIERRLRAAWDTVVQGHRRAGELQIQTKKGDAADLVTQFDVQVQREIEDALAAEFPGDVLVAEESGRDKPPADPDARCWLLDPIDGTHNFARGLVPAFGISLAFARGGIVEAAGIALPSLDELLLAERGGGATRNGVAIRVSDIDDLKAARLEIDFARLPGRARTMELAGGLLRAAGQIRATGACIVSMAAVAAGCAEGYIHAAPHPWDYAAGALIIAEAGGMVTHLDGSPLRLFDGPPGIIASNARLHQQLCKMAVS